MQKTLIGAIALCWSLVSPVEAQTRPSTTQRGSLTSTSVDDSSLPLKTSIEFELVAPGALAGDTRTRDWAELLQEQGASVRIRQPLFDDELGVTEKVRGTLRWVKVIATFDDMGKLILPEETFSRSDSQRLNEWIEELKLYGAQGSPEGKPLWGLSEEQFNTLFTAMSEPVPVNSYGETLDVAIQQMNLPASYAVRYHSTAAAHLASMQPVDPVRQRLAGLSRGTSLAIMLADYGLGFRPLRTPTKEIELVIQPLTDISDPWPVGWDLDKETRRGDLAPNLFKMVPVKFDNIPVQAVLDEIASVTGVPVVVNHYLAKQKEINLDEITLSYPSRKAAWISVINSAAARNRMKQELRLDEQSHPFVLIAPFIPRPRPE